MKMMMLRPNKYIKKILDGSKRFVDKGLTLEQIQWRGENKNDEVLGLMTTTGTFFKKPLQLILLQKSDGGYRLFTVRSKKDGIIVVSDPSKVPTQLDRVVDGTAKFKSLGDFQYGAERLGALTIPAAAGNSKRQIKFISDFKTTVLHAIPSYAVRLAEVLQESGIEPSSTSLRILVIGAEPHTDEQRRKIERMLGVKAYNSFGMTEMNGPGVAFECIEQNGMHLWEDCYLAEIIDPDTGEVLPEGEIGELVLTTLDREMMPLIRYRTRDLTRILPGSCPCGRTHLRLDRIKGRSDDMFIIKGVNIFPMQVEKILVQFPELGSNYLITLDTINNQDEMIIEVELSDLSTDNYVELENIRRIIMNRLRDEILVTPKLKLVKKGTLPQSDGKAVRVKDLRNNH